MGSEFLTFFNLDVIAGRGVVQGDDPWSKKDAFINEKLALLLGFESPEEAIGAKLSGFWAPLEVRGVIENHHHNSLHEDYEPIVYILSSWTEYYFVKFNLGEDLPLNEKKAAFKHLVNSVEEEWSQTFPNYSIDYFFLDRFYNHQYAEDEYFGTIFSIFSLLAITIACLGLYGLTSFTIKQRTKEIGIRKVLGADAQNLLFLLSKKYIILIAIAYFISMPIAWLSMQKWLQEYAFHIEPGIWLLVVPFGLVVLIASSTLISRILIAVKMNPVKSLRYE
jgi:putative ABC transport system permease protein